MVDRTTPLHEEPVRAFISACIHHALIPGDNQPPEQPAEVRAVTGFRVGPSEVRLRVKLDNDTFRTFTITLRENR